MQLINPATEALITSVDSDSQATIQNKFTRAKTAQKNWQSLPLSKRINCLKNFSAALEKQAPELAQTLSTEVGKPLQESKNEINGARARVGYFVEYTEQHLATRQVHSAGGLNEEISYDPLGVIANISAWNYPYLVAINVIVPALMGGNAVLYKPSEFATLTGLLIGKLIHESGIPQDVFQVIKGEGEAGRALCELPLDGYFFTGSYKTGLAIAKSVAHKLVPVGLELGGKDPLYVMDDVADVAQVAAAAVEGAFYNNGQSCCAVERVYVHQNVYNEFVTHFVNEAKKLKPGDPFDPATTQGPLTRKPQLNVLKSQVQDAVARGAKLVLGGKRVERPGYFFEPTVLVDVNHEMLIMKDESFGPVIGIQKVKDDDEAIQLMNDTEYGLTAAVYGRDELRAHGILARVNSGTSYFNCCDRVSAHLPWAGRGHSGLGATLSQHGIFAFVKPRGWHLRPVTPG